MENNGFPGVIGNNVILSNDIQYNLGSFFSNMYHPITLTYLTCFFSVVGSIDGSHIRLDKPFEDPVAYINKKHYFSVHMQGVVNEDGKFLDVLIGYPGSVHDARVFANSSFVEDLPALCQGINASQLLYYCTLVRCLCFSCLIQLKYITYFIMNVYSALDVNLSIHFYFRWKHISWRCCIPMPSPINHSISR